MNWYKRASGDRDADYMAAEKRPDLSAIWGVLVPQDLAVFEQAHVGGIADLGKADAKYMVWRITDYSTKIRAVRDAIRKTLGSKFVLYRAMSRKQLRAWRNGEDVGPMSGTVSKSLAQRFVNLAAVKDKDRVVVAVPVTPEMIVMRGSENESELVFDANEVSADTVMEVFS